MGTLPLIEIIQKHRDTRRGEVHITVTLRLRSAYSDGLVRDIYVPN
jgi:hypothetical protein